MLKATQLYKSHSERKIVDNLSLQLQRGEVVGLLGPNGAGKTTSFHLLTGLIGCDQGAIYLNDEEITHYPIHKRAQMGLGYLPQESSVFRKLSVEDNILAILQTRLALSPAKQQQQLTILLNELNINHLKKARAITLSGGERRRVEIARSLAAGPQFLLLDEPFAGIDPIAISEVQQLITQLRDKQIGILITDHSVRATLGICDRAYVISQGQVIAAGKPEQILADQQVRAVYLGDDF